MFRQTLLLKETIQRFMWVPIPDIRLTFVNIDKQSIYLFYWLSFNTIKTLEKMFKIDRSDDSHIDGATYEDLFSMYKIAAKLYIAYRNDKILYMSKSDFPKTYKSELSYLDLDIIQDFGFSKIGKRYILNSNLRTVEKLKSVLNGKSKLSVKESDIDRLISEYENIIEYQFDDEQISAIKSSILSKSRTHSITGMPGTGKSTITICVIYIMVHLDMNIKVLTFTGKASSRLNSIISTSGSGLDIQS